MGSRVVAVDYSSAPTSGYSSVFTVTVYDPAGYQSIVLVDLLINFGLDAHSACYVALVPSGPASGLLYLVDNSGQNLSMALTLPGSDSRSNSQCTISASGSSVATGGNTLVLTLSVSFAQTWAGTKVLYASAQNNYSQQPNSGWHPTSTFTVGTPAFSTKPTWGVGSIQTFTFTFTDPYGWQNSNVLDVLLNNGLDGRNACYVGYDVNSQMLYLINDAGTGTAGALDLSGSGSGSPTVSNSQCTINRDSSGHYSIGNTYSLILSMSFNTATFSGDRIFYLAAFENAGSFWNSGWQAAGAWRVQ